MEVGFEFYWMVIEMLGWLVFSVDDLRWVGWCDVDVVIIFCNFGCVIYWLMFWLNYFSVVYFEIFVYVMVVY